MGEEWFNRMDEEGETPVSRAMRSGHAALRSLLERAQAEECAGVLAGASLLQQAAYWGLGNAVRTLIDRGANPSERDMRGETPLHKAARRGHREVVRALVEKGAEVDARNALGMTTLHWTALNGRGDIAELLIESGADVNARDQFTGGLTPLAMAKLMEYEEVAEVLGRHGGRW